MPRYTTDANGRHYMDAGLGWVPLGDSGDGSPTQTNPTGVDNTVLSSRASYTDCECRGRKKCCMVLIYTSNGSALQGVACDNGGSPECDAPTTAPAKASASTYVSDLRPVMELSEIGRARSR